MVQLSIYVTVLRYTTGHWRSLLEQIADLIVHKPEGKEEIIIERIQLITLADRIIYIIFWHKRCSEVDSGMDDLVDGALKWPSTKKKCVFSRESKGLYLHVQEDIGTPRFLWNIEFTMKFTKSIIIILIYAVCCNHYTVQTLSKYRHEVTPHFILCYINKDYLFNHDLFYQ